MQDRNEKNKWIGLKAQLAERIVSGNYEFNQRFPGLQQVAAEYHVSYVTADKALKALASEGYLRCKNGIGHFVSYISAETVLPQKRVQFIVSRNEYRERKGLFQEAERLFQSYGWCVQILQCPVDDVANLVEKINSPDTYSIVCGLSVPWQHLQASFGHVAKRVLVLGSLAGSTEITSIISDEYATIQQAVAYFEKQDRHRIAIASGRPSLALEALRLGAWYGAMRKSGLSPEWIAKHCFSYSENKQKYLPAQEYPRLVEWLQSIKDDTDGLIVPLYHRDIIEACLDCGIQIPREISLLLIARTTPVLDWESSKPLPDIDVLDHNYAGHFQCALEILEERFRSGKNASEIWYFCQPGKIQKLVKSERF